MAKLGVRSSAELGALNVRLLKRGHRISGTGAPLLPLSRADVLRWSSILRQQRCQGPTIQVAHPLA